MQAVGAAHEASENEANVARMVAEVDAKRAAETSANSVVRELPCKHDFFSERLETASTPLLEHLWATYVEKPKSRKGAKKKAKMRGERHKVFFRVFLLLHQ